MLKVYLQAYSKSTTTTVLHETIYMCSKDSSFERELTLVF